MADLNPELGRTAVLNEGAGAKIIASNQCGDFPFKLMKMTDPRVDTDSIADYDKNVIAYVGARNWNKFKYDKEYTNPSQLKFSNIKNPGPTYLVDMKWWIDYQVEVTFRNFPYPHESGADNTPCGGRFGALPNWIAFRPYPLHQCTDNIHLRLNNRDITTYPMQMLNARLEYWKQEKLKDSCGFCPHRKPNVQTTYEYVGGRNMGRSPWINPGATYDGDWGNECGATDIVCELTVDRKTLDNYGYEAPDADDEDAGPDLGGRGAPAVVNGTITFWMREPVITEPLDYFSQRGASKTMNNVSDIDLEYNFNCLRNMFIFNRGALITKAGDTIDGRITILNNEYDEDSTDWYNDLLENVIANTMSVKIIDAKLVMDVATPQVPAKLPFVTDFVDYKRLETKSNIAVDLEDIVNDKNKIYEIDSDIYSISYMPNSIYIWVAPNDATTTGTNQRNFYNNTYAQITGLEVDYGNLTRIGHNYDEKDLYLMALRNGLEDRTFADWTRTRRVFSEAVGECEVPTDLETANALCDREFFGVGSVLRIIPGIDLCSGGEQTLIGGMKVSNETIRFHVKYRPLNMFDDEVHYSLFVAFESNGICTLTPGFCDIAMIHIDSYNQIANAERAPRFKISRVYGKGVWDKIKSGLSKVGNFAKKTGAVSKVLSMVPHPAAQMGSMAANAMGFGYKTGRRSTRMKGGRVIPPGSFYRTY